MTTTGGDDINLAPENDHHDDNHDDGNVDLDGHDDTDDTTAQTTVTGGTGGRQWYNKFQPPSGAEHDSGILRRQKQRYNFRG